MNLVNIKIMLNQTIIQLFHWFLPEDDGFWKKMLHETPWLKELGFTMAWLPPSYKSFKGTGEPGYAVYDLYDLGEFDQCGSVGTKYGTKEEYLKLVNQLQQEGIVPVADIVLNHKLGGDEQEEIPVREVNKEDRTKYLSEEQIITAKSKFVFPGRGDKYSPFKWTWECFSGFEKDEKLWKIQSEYSKDGWDSLIVAQKGNFNYLLGFDIEYRNPHVKEELFNWLRWFKEQTGHYAFRLDGIKHMNPDFVKEFIQVIHEITDDKRIIIGEFLSYKPEDVVKFLEHVDHTCQLYDFPLHKNLVEAAKAGAGYDLRKIFDGSLSQLHPMHAITYVDNHDTQPLQEEDNYVPDWFRPAAYALILLREAGIPTVFFCDVFGAAYEMDGKKINLPKLELLPALLELRRDYAYGKQRDFFAGPQTIGWTREGNGGNFLGVIISHEQEGGIEMQFGNQHAGKILRRVNSAEEQQITLDENGRAWFPHDAELLQLWKYQAS